MLFYSEIPTVPLQRKPTAVLPPSEQISSFVIKASEAQYAHQYAQIYYARLELLREHVIERAKARWKDAPGVFQRSSESDIQ